VTAIFVSCTLIFDSAELGRYSSMAGFFYKVGGLFMKSIEQGAATQVDKFTKSCHSFSKQQLASQLSCIHNHHKVYCALRADPKDCMAWFMDCGTSGKFTRDR
jgi:hypothetical protein